MELLIGIYLCCHYFQRFMARKTILEAVEANHGHHRGRGEAKERGHWGGEVTGGEDTRGGKSY